MTKPQYLSDRSHELVPPLPLEHTLTVAADIANAAAHMRLMDKTLIGEGGEHHPGVVEDRALGARGKNG